MKKLLLSVSACLVLTSGVNAQTSLYLEDFESGGGSFTLNTSDESSTTISTQNNWVMNNSYTGGSGTFVCLGFPFTFTVPSTPGQPGGITGSPNSTYLHIAADAAISSGITCASYIPADGTCAFAENHFSKMTSSISTSGYTGVNIDFWWLNGGSPEAYGEVYYSLNGGTSWTLEQTSMQAQSNWTNTVLTNAAWDNQPTIMFGFRFVNAVSGTGSDPAFGIDDVEIFGTSGGSNTITTATNLLPTAWCEGTATTIVVDFTSTGTFNSGNIYSAELSDATGLFAAPTVIGTVNSVANSDQIIAIVPGGTPAGTGYRIRVVSDNPATTGSDNGSDLTIHPNPAVTQQAFADVCLDGGTVNLVGGSPSGGTYSGTGVSGSSFDPTVPGTGATSITYTYSDGNSCQGSATEEIFVNPSPTVTLNSFTNVCHFDPFFTLTGGTPSNGTYTGPGVTNGVFDPDAAGVGVHSITYTFTDGNGCSGTATETLEVEMCGSVLENEIQLFALFPNPANEKVELSTGEQIESIALLDMSGRTIKTFDPNSKTLEISEIPSGVYFVRVSINGIFSEQRLTIQ